MFRTIRHLKCTAWQIRYFPIFMFLPPQTLTRLSSTGDGFLRIESKLPDGVKTIGKVRVTDLERKIVDIIKDFTKIGGLEELLLCLTMITYTDAEKLVRYLTLYNNQFLWQKTGYILSEFPNMKLSPEFFDECKKHIEKSVRYFYPELKYEGSDYASEWSISVLQEPPFTDQGSVAEIFTDLSVWLGIRKVIEAFNANAIAA